MFNKLPPNIIGLIYEYDNTYREVFKVVLEEIKAYNIFNPKFNNFTVRE